MRATPLVPPHYASVKAVAVEASNWGLPLAIAALGLTTSVKATIALGWRHIAVVGASAVLLVIMTGGLAVLQPG